MQRNLLLTLRPEDHLKSDIWNWNKTTQSIKQLSACSSLHITSYEEGEVRVAMTHLASYFLFVFVSLLLSSFFLYYFFAISLFASFLGSAFLVFILH